MPDKYGTGSHVFYSVPALLPNGTPVLVYIQVHFEESIYRSVVVTNVPGTDPQWLASFSDYVFLARQDASTLRVHVFRIGTLWVHEALHEPKQPWTQLMLTVDIDLNTYGATTIDNRTGITPTDTEPRFPVWVMS